LPLLSITHHALKIRAPIRAARHGLVSVNADDADSVLRSEIGTLSNLLLDAFLLLAMGRIAGIDYANLFS